MVKISHNYATVIELVVVQFRNVYAKSTAHFMFIKEIEY